MLVRCFKKRVIILKLPSLFSKKQPKSVQVRSKRYYKNADEPKDNPNHDSSNNDEIVLEEDSSIMRRRFRGIAKRIRVIKDMRQRKEL